MAEKDPAITELQSQLKALDTALEGVEKGAKAARGALGETGDAAKESAVKTGVLTTALGNLAATGLERAIDATREWVTQIPEAASRAEAHAGALAALGGAYGEVERATNGAVSAEQAMQVQQRVSQAGLQLSGRELAAVTQRAREYARATHTDLGQALEQLTDQLIHPGEELARFGVRLQQGMHAGDALRETLRQLTAQADAGARSTQTLAEAHDDFNRALTEANDVTARFVAESLDLQGFFREGASFVRQMTTETDRWRLALEAAIGTAREAVGLRSETDRAQNQSRSGAFVGQYGALLQQARAAGIDTRSMPMAGALAQADDTQQRAILSALQRDIAARGQVRLAGASVGTRDMFGLGQDVSGLPSIGVEGGGASAASTAAAVAANLAARSAMAAAVAAKAGAASSAARSAEIASRNAASASPASASAPIDTTAADFARGRAPVSSEWATAFTARAREIEAQDLAARGGSIGTRAEGIEMQRRSRDAQIGVGRGGEGDFDPTSRGGQAQAARERVTVLREQREALRSLLVEAEHEEQLARASGASQSEVNDLMRQRIGIQTALAQSTTELTAATAENSRHLDEFKDKMGEAASGMADGFATAAVAALDGSKSFDVAMKEMLRSTLKTVAQMAIVEALKNTALAIGHLAAFNYAGAANAGLAVAAWTAVGIAAGAAISATNSWEQQAQKPSSGASSSSPRPDTGSARPDRSTGGGPLNLNITVSGAIFETRHEVLQGIARGMTDAVHHGYLAPGALGAVQ